MLVLSSRSLMLLFGFFLSLHAFYIPRAVSDVSQAGEIQGNIEYVAIDRRIPKGGGGGGKGSGGKKPTRPDKTSEKPAAPSTKASSAAPSSTPAASSAAASSTPAASSAAASSSAASQSTQAPSSSQASASVSKSESSSTFKTPNYKVPRPTAPVDTCLIPRNRNCEDDYDNLAKAEPEVQARNLQKRGGTRPFTAKVGPVSNGLSADVGFSSLPYPSSSELFETKKGQALAKTVFDYSAKDDFSNFKVKDLNAVPASFGPFVTEHIVELQSVKMFLEFATGQGGQTPSSKVNGDFFSQFWAADVKAKIDTRPNKFTTVKGDTGKRSKMSDLVFEALGSTPNRNDFVLCEKEINAYKESLWSSSSPMDIDKYDKLSKDVETGALDSSYIMSPLRTTLAVFDYMNQATVVQRMQNAVANVATELKNAEHLAGESPQDAAGNDVDLSELWKEFMTGHLEKVAAFGKKYITDRITTSSANLKTKLTRFEKELKEVERKEKQKGPAKTTFEKQRQKDTEKLDKEFKTLDEAARKAEDDVKKAAKTLKDSQDKVDKEKDRTKKAALKKSEDIDGKKAAVKREEAKALEAEKKRNLKDVERFSLYPAAIKQMIDNVKKDQKLLDTYKTAATAAKMPKAQ